MAGALAGNDLLLRSFTRSLRARNRSPRTVQSYVEAARLLTEHVRGRDLTKITRADIEDFLTDQLQRHRPTSVAVRFRSLQQFYRWMVDEELVDASPMAGLRPPTVPEEPVAVLDDQAITRLLAVMTSHPIRDAAGSAIIG